MEKRSFSLRRIMAGAVAMLFVSGILVACKKDLGSSPSAPSAGLMVFNLAPDQQAAGVALSKSLVTNSPLPYTGFNGRYQGIYAGQREIESFNFLNDSILATSTQNFEADKYYSTFIVGHNGVYTNITVQDDVDSSAPSTNAYIRFVNAIPDSTNPVVTITAAGTKLADASAPFSEVSPFTAVAGGDVNIAVTNGNTISANRTVSLENGNVYTALLVGIPGHTDSTKAVQIRYILNGTVPATTEK